jgi:hypothetical protein
MRPFHATLAPGGQSGVTHTVGAGGVSQLRRRDAFRSAPDGMRAWPIVSPSMLTKWILTLPTRLPPTNRAGAAG